MKPENKNYMVSVIKPGASFAKLPHGLTASDDNLAWLWLPEDSGQHPGPRLTHAEALDELQPDAGADFYQLFAPPRQLPARLWNGEQLPGTLFAFTVVLEDVLLPAIPAIKSAAAYDGKHLVLLKPEQLSAFVSLHKRCTWLCHRAGLVYEALKWHVRRYGDGTGGIWELAFDQRLRDVRVLDWLCRAPLPAGFLGLFRTLPTLARESILRAEPGSEAARQLGALFQWNPRETQAAPWGFLAGEAVAVFNVHQGLQQELSRKGLPFGLQGLLADGVAWEGVLTSATVGQYSMHLHGVPVQENLWQEHRLRLDNDVQRATESILESNQRYGVLRCVDREDGSHWIYPDDMQVRRVFDGSDRQREQPVFQHSERGWLAANLLQPSNIKLSAPFSTLVELVAMVLRQQNIGTLLGETINARAAMLGKFDPSAVVFGEMVPLLRLPATGKLMVAQVKLGALESAPHLSLWLAPFMAALLESLEQPCYGVFANTIVMPLASADLVERQRKFVHSALEHLRRLLKHPELVTYDVEICETWEQAAQLLSPATTQRTG
jgi:hypothetical protein